MDMKKAANGPNSAHVNDGPLHPSGVFFGLLAKIGHTFFQPFKNFDIYFRTSGFPAIVIKSIITFNVNFFVKKNANGPRNHPWGLRQSFRYLQASYYEKIQVYFVVKSYLVNFQKQ